MNMLASVVSRLVDSDKLAQFARRRNSSTLLLVDDDPIFCSVLKHALETRGFEIYIARDVKRSFELTEQVKFRYAVIDLSIGQESGLAVVKRLTESDANTRIVILTGYLTVATAVQALKLGADNYLTKPVDADEIVAALHKQQGNAGGCSS